MNENREKNIVVPIPENFASEGTFLGYEINFLNIAQALVFGIIPFAFTFGIINKYFYIGTTTIVITCMFALGLAYLGFFGINHETPVEYLVKYLMFRKNARKTYYNPRVKIEARSIFEEKNDEADVLPREKIMKIYNDFLKKRNLSDQKLAHELEDKEYDGEIFFEEDFAIVDKPIEYMDKKEKRQMEKEEKKAIKMRRKINKQMEKEEKKNAKRKDK